MHLSAPRLTACRGLAGLWAGLCLGGSLLAAPAKFQVESLTRSVALEVGRVQFYWVALAEIVLAVSLLLSCTLTRARIRWLWLLVVTAIFALQQVVLMTLLAPRTDQGIAGAQVGASSLHIQYVLFEVVKVGLLAAVSLGWLRLERSGGPSS